MANQKKFIIDGGLHVAHDSSILANVEMGGHIIPNVDSNGTTGFDLGSPDYKWRDLYLSEGSLYINNQKVIEDNSGTIIVRADEDQSLTVKTEGTGVLTFQSAQTVNMAATLQMAAGKKITDAGGDAVTFGDKVDMDGNKVVNLGAPTADLDAATKKYVDDKMDDVVGGAPGALDTLNELANALGDDANYAATITTALGTKASTTYVDAQIASVTSSASTAGSDAAAAQTTADAAVATGATNAGAITSLQASVAANAADIATNSGAVTSAIATAASDATAKANAAEAAAVATAAADATSKADAAVVAAASASATAIANATTSITNAYNVAISNESTAISNAYATAIASASASAEAYADAAIANLMDSAPGALDTLNELAAAMGDDANFASTVTNNIASAKADAISTAAADATSKADDAETAAISAAASDATSKANAAQAAAISAAASDATSKANTAKSQAISAAASDATSKADAAESAAISAAASDATSKADAAEAAAVATANAFASAQVSAEASARATAIASASASANAYADAQVSALVNGASSAFDTLKEIQDAMATDAELSAAINGLTIGNGTVTMSAGNGLSGGGAFSMNQTNSETVSFAMSGSFTGGFTATGDITAYSDESLKTNIQTIDGALGRVEAIRGVTFDRLEDGSTSTGVVAQELEAVLPEAVKTDENGLKHVAYGNITGLLIEAVKELSAQVEELKK